MIKKLLSKIYEKRIIAIIRGVGSDRIIDTAGALLEGEISILEVTFNHDSEQTINDTLISLEKLKTCFGDRIQLGVGTVLTKDQAISAIDAGADFVISPNIDPEVISITKKLNKVSIPGAFTPSEIVMAHNCGADIVKLFPAGVLGISYMKSIMAPLRHIPLIAVGGIDCSNAKEYFKAGAVGVGIGGNLVDIEAVYNGEYKRLTATAKEFILKIKD